MSDSSKPPGEDNASPELPKSPPESSTEAPTEAPEVPEVQSVPLEPASLRSASASRDRAVVLTLLGVLLLAVTAAVAILSGGRGVWNAARAATFALPFFLGLLVVAAGVGLTRTLEPTLAPAKTHPDLLRVARALAAIEPYEVWIVFAAALAIMIPGSWSYSLIDPWEGHYAEVARRILEDSDWVHLKWQNEVFRSKPVLTFWLIATSMNGLGVAQDGGYSGEMLSSAWVVMSVRLPFILFGAFGIASIFWMLSNLVSRRVAWMAAGVLATTTFYFMVARQAITDMPMVACVMAAIAAFAMTLERGNEALEPIAGSLNRSRVPLLSRLARINPLHVFALVFALVIVAQALYYGLYFAQTPLARGVRMPAPGLMIAGSMLITLAIVTASMFVGFPAKTRGQVWMFWFYTLVGIAFLAKGPPGLGLIGLVCLSYLVVTGRWTMLRRFEIIRGVFVAALVAVPWHMAMWMRDGPAWVNEYFNHHMIGRFTKGVHGERGTFEYFANQLGIGLWPWAALVPAAIAAVVLTASLKDRESRVRLVVGLWAVAGVTMFSISQTKFHHYILPAVPALAICVAFFLDDIWRRRTTRLVGAAVTGAAIVLLICRDLLGEQEKLIELYIYRYDRPWPVGEPWNLDITSAILGFGIVFGLLVMALALPVIKVLGQKELSQKLIIACLFVAALAWSGWAGTSYMKSAGPHWGQRALHEMYYAERQIHGIDVKYYGLHEVARDWDGRSAMSIRSLLPNDFTVGQPATVNLEIPNVGLENNTMVLHGAISDAGENSFTVAIPEAELTRLQPFIEQGRRARAAHPRWRQVNADRLLTWQLNWRGENFWAAGEIYGEIGDTQTVFTHTDNKAFNKYIKKDDKKGRTFYVITEAGRAKGMKGILPTPRGKETFEILDTSNNKFTLMRFSL